ncbi:Agmatine deiminase [bacterium HR39]|nr:Agmatine deiminase [bacterium HR39]
MSTPRELGYGAVPEWHAHARCWMAWPCREELWGERLAAARRAVARIARTIARFEPVTVIVRPDLVADASLELGRGISILPMAHDDSWTRDTGPLFVAREWGERAGVIFRFNGWGELWRPYEQDARMAEAIIARIGIPAFRSQLVLEGGAIELDGEGTAIVCEPSVLDPARNPGTSRAEVEHELSAMLAVEKVIWLPAGLVDDETKGHVDNVARFVAPGVVVLARDAKGPHRIVLEAAREVLELERDARGRRLDIVPVDLPEPRRRPDGRLLTASYANFYLANDAVILPSFADPADQRAYRTFGQLFPEREIVMEDALDVLQGGGGIHCITRDEPAGAS